MGTVTYQVMREHLGDRQYAQGETRELEASDAKHLVEAGVLKPADEVMSETAAAKQEAVEAHKAPASVPQNKAQPKFKPLADDE